MSPRQAPGSGPGEPGTGTHPMLQAAADAENLIGGISDLLSPVREFDFPDIASEDFPRDLTAAEQVTLLRLLSKTVSSIGNIAEDFAGTRTEVGDKAGNVLAEASEHANRLWRALEQVPGVTGIQPADGPEPAAVLDFPAAAGPVPPAGRPGAGRARAARTPFGKLAGRRPGRRG